MKYKCPSPECTQPEDTFERGEPGDDFCPYCGYEYVGEEIIAEEQGELF